MVVAIAKTSASRVGIAKAAVCGGAAGAETVAVVAICACGAVCSGCGTVYGGAAVAELHVLIVAVVGTVASSMIG